MPLSPNSNSPNSYTAFGDLLKYLRRRAHLTQLELSITVGYSEGQISRLEKNLRLPDLTALKALFIPVLHLEGEPQLTARLLELAQSARQDDAPAPGISPYKGLLFFDESDADLFFGREALTARLAEHVIDLAMDSSTRFLAVVGASGSGKSSLVRAGLAVALTRAGWDVRIFTPTGNPLKILEANLNSARTKSAERVLILVDQFEEVFTLCHDEIERIAFIENLLSSAQDRSEKITVVIALRADFYSHCAQYPWLRQAVAAEQEYIGQMTAEELRRAIEEPAKRGGWDFEPGLVDVLLNDIGAQGTSEPEPGALPLLSHALLATWEHRRGHIFTLDGYRASGGVRGAIAETAESVFNDQLNQTQQELARDVFLRLTELGEGTEDTRRRAALNELVRQPAEATQLRAVLNTLAEARLITLNEDSAEVAHEALIREWQRLHEWLTQDREGLVLHRHITESVHEWETRGHDLAELYRGARLAQVREWASANEERLNASEQAFLAASIDQEQHAALEREAQRQRELEAAQTLAEAQRQRAEAEKQRAEIESERAKEHVHTATQLRKRALYLTGAFVIALIMALTALFFGAQARQSALTAQTNERTALSRELAAASISNLDVDPERSILLSLEAVSLTYSMDKSWTTEAEDALRRALVASRVELTLRGHTDRVEGVAFSPNGTRLATSSDDGTAKVWDAATGQELLSLPMDGSSTNIAFSPDGTRLAVPNSIPFGPWMGWAPGLVGTAKVWDVATGEELLTVRGHRSWVSGIVFSPDGTHLATASEDSTAKVWDAATGQELFTLAGHTEWVSHVTFNPDGTHLATASYDKTAKVWDAITGQELRTFAGHTDRVSHVAFNSDGTRLATASYDKTAIIWDVATGKELFVLRSHSDAVASAVFSPDGRRLATTSLDGETRLWDVATGQELFTLAGHTGSVVGAAFSPDGARLATASHDGTVKVWNVSLSRELLTVSFPSQSELSNISRALSPDGVLLATGFQNGTAKVWDISSGLGAEWPTGKELLTLRGHTDQVNGFAFSSDRTLLATTSHDGTAKVWDAITGQEILTLRGYTDVVWAVAFSPDGKRLATVGIDLTLVASVKVWDLAGTTKQALLTLPLSAKSDSITFSPDGTRLAAGLFDPGTKVFDAPSKVFDAPAKVWDLASGQELLSLRGQIGGVRALSFSPDGASLATAGQDGTVKIWDTETGRELLMLPGHAAGINDVAFSPDGTHLGTAGQDGTVKLWDAATGQELLTLHDHTSPVVDVAFSPECANHRDAPTADPFQGAGRCRTRLVTTGEDGTVRFYLLRIEDLVALAKSRLTRTLTSGECQQYLHVATCPAEP